MYSEKMESVVNNLGIVLHAGDFANDQEALRWDTPSARWLWSVDPKYGGTLLARIGADFTGAAFIRAGAETGERLFFLLSGGEIRQVSKEKAMKLLDEVEYDVDLIEERQSERARSRKGRVMRRGEHIADVLTFAPHEGRGAVTVRFYAVTELTSDDIAALRWVAIEEAVRATGTLFSWVQECTLDGEALEDLFFEEPVFA